MRPYILITALTVALARPVGAQTLDRPFGASASAGIEALGGQYGSSWNAGFTAQLGLYARPTRDAWAIRLTGTFYNRQSDARIQMAGWAAELSYDLSRGATRPYVLGGVGMDWLFRSLDQPADPLGHWSGAWILGAGVQHRFAGLWWFAEARYHHMTKGSFWGSQAMPLTVGVRF
ncbi:MAG TPA: outer membrane beta-barrel protein [Gemmatimonadales bacterium]|nr:outer membrane beta-barrel protein [Gemmatimonadales bacterium]